MRQDFGFQAYSWVVDDVVEELNTNLKMGLPSNEVWERLARFGENKLKEAERASAWKLLLLQFKDFLIYILLFGVLLSFALGDYVETVAILFMVITNGIIGYIQESKAEDAFEALQKLSMPEIVVLRDGHKKKIKSTDLVIGDVVFLEQGDYVPADIRLAETVSLKIEEAALTGESEAVSKGGGVLLEQTILAERSNMAYMGTIVVQGRGKGAVVATGMNTELGKISHMMQKVEQKMTPLQQQLNSLGKVLGAIFISLCLLILLLNVFWRGESFSTALLDAVALAIAAVPEGLPAVVTICLALGVGRMYQKNVLVRKLSAVETLGSVGYVCTDKTGTVTEGKMTVTHIFHNGKINAVNIIGNEPNSLLEKMIAVATLCNNAEEDVGSPTEVALISWVKGHKLKEEWERLHENPFSSSRKMMSTIHQKRDKKVALVKGAPEILLSKSKYLGELSEKENKFVKSVIDQETLTILEKAINDLSNQGLRVLALAEKPLQEGDSWEIEEVEKDLLLLGLVGIKDPVRQEARRSIEHLQEAGIQTVMITGDKAETAYQIAKEAGIIEAALDMGSVVITGSELDQLSQEEFLKRVGDVYVYARVTPEHKLRIIEALQAQDNIVAMTGDGVNDAPAIKSASVGMAMGIKGTEVTKESSDIVLTDDNYQSISNAAREGRVIADRIKLFINYLLSCNFAEVGIFLVTILFNLPIPLHALKLLWLNLVTDLFPALALATEAAEPGIMRRPPRPSKEPIIDSTMRIHIGVQTIAKTSVVILAFWLALPRGEVYASTIAFLVLAISELFRAFTVRNPRFSVFTLGLFSNANTNKAVFISLIMTLVIVYIPFLRPIFDTAHVSLAVLGTCILLAFVPAIFEEITKIFIRRKYSLQKVSSNVE